MFHTNMIKNEFINLINIADSETCVIVEHVKNSDTGEFFYASTLIIIFKL